MVAVAQQVVFIGHRIDVAVERGTLDIDARFAKAAA